MAMLHGLNGWVLNQTDGLTINIEGPPEKMPAFLQDLRRKAPAAAQVEEILVEQVFPEGLTGFSILASRDLTNETSEISPDIAVCPDCLQDMDSQEHRKDYPFVNCTNCGPRFSIIRDFPYDRKNTTMDHFAMCSICRKEYEDIADRRFHAQPVACRHCGPAYTLHGKGLETTDIQKIIEITALHVQQGKIIALKGMGGYHLMCDAMNEEAVDCLRKSKKREGKPFAVMFRNTDAISQYADLSEIEEQVLLSWKRPIVILNASKPLAHSISLGLPTIGAFLPYMPFHHLLFEKLETNAVVLTSGNIAEEPIIIDNKIAGQVFARVADVQIDYNRDIYNRIDDSVVRIMAGEERLIRRSRGYVPAAIRLPFNVNGIFAAGAELSNCFCLGKDKRAYVSQHIGDLKNHETFEFYVETYERFLKIFRITPAMAVADLHPDYLSTGFARKLGIPCVGVQHHHAHIVSCMAENGVDEKVIGLAFDGTGYGDDGNIWGSEFLVCDYQEYIRMGHFEYMSMPGGDKASEEPWRMGISLLKQTYGDSFLELDLPFLKTIGREKAGLIAEAISKKINCPLSSGAGRLFDAVAAITGICLHALFHAEAPMRLEAMVENGIPSCYDFTMNQVISFSPVIHQIVADIRRHLPVGIIAAKFHNTIVEASVQMTGKISAQTGIRKVVLSGGTFQNRYLFELLQLKLRNKDFEVFSHRKVPCNDGGLALGQLVIAARKNRITNIF
jgi:hydrogenase maturation protein HypF